MGILEGLHVSMLFTAEREGKRNRSEYTCRTLLRVSVADRESERKARGSSSQRPPFRMANLRTKILDFRGFDSSRILILRGGIILSIGNSPEFSSRRILGVLLAQGDWAHPPMSAAPRLRTQPAAQPQPVAPPRPNPTEDPTEDQGGPLV